MQQPKEQSWEKKYLNAIKQLCLPGQDLKNGRANPRFKMTDPSKILLVSIEGHTGMLNDFSAGGLSFFLEHDLSSDIQATLSIDQKFSGPVRILESHRMDPKSNLRGGMYRIGARFLFKEDGFRCMVNTMRLLGHIS